MTLEDIKNREINYEMKQHLKKTHELYDSYNYNVYRYRMKSKKYIQWNVDDMTHEGNDPRSSEEVLDRAKLFYDEHIFTDKEWNKYFIPAINDLLIYNKTFERWHPGYLIKDVEGNFAIVEHDYAEAFGGRCFTSLAICQLDSEGNITCSWAWAEYADYCLVSKDPDVVSKNLEKIRKRVSEIGDGAPIGMNSELAKKLGFTSIHTYESARASGWEAKEGAIKLY